MIGYSKQTLIVQTSGLQQSANTHMGYASRMRYETQDKPQDTNMSARERQDNHGEYIAMHGLLKKELQAIKNCRLFLQVFTLADITGGSGEQVTTEGIP